MKNPNFGQNGIDAVPKSEVLTELEQKRINIERIKESLDQINFSVIKDIFAQLLLRYGVDANDGESLYTRKFISRDDIRPDLTGEYSEDEMINAIALTKSEVQNTPGQKYSKIVQMIEFSPMSKAFRIEQAWEYPFFPTILKALIHEEVHAMQFSGDIEISRDGTTHVNSTVRGLSEERFTIRDTGEDSEQVNLESEQKVNLLLNEGLAEVIADRVTEEYLRRVGKPELIGKFFKTYPVGRIILELLVRKISDVSNTSREEVLDGLMIYSFKGVSLLSGKTRIKIGPEAQRFLETFKHLDRSDVDYEKQVEILCHEYVNLVGIGNTKDQSVIDFLRKRKFV